MAKCKPLLPQAVLLELIRYEPVTGGLFWRPRPQRYFRSRTLWLSWNTQYSGQQTFIAKTVDGYLKAPVLGSRFLAHRVIWKVVHNAEPPEIDHINGDRADNRLANLRAADRFANARNTCLQKNNTSGTPGVYWDKFKKRWRAEIFSGKDKINLGRFREKPDAVVARKRAEIKFGFHENHGRPPC